MSIKQRFLCGLCYFSIGVTAFAPRALAFEKPKPAWHEPTISDKFLPLAVAQEDFLFVRWLLQSGADVNVQDGTGATPLIIAAKSGNNAMMKLLIEKGADVNANTFYIKQTALMIASHQVNMEAIELLLAHSADINISDTHGQTALSEVYNAASRYQYRPGTLAARQLEQYEKRRQTIIQVLKNAGAKEYAERESFIGQLQVPRAIRYVRVGANVGF